MALDTGTSWHAVSIATGIPYSTVKKHARALGYSPPERRPLRFSRLRALKGSRPRRLPFALARSRPALVRSLIFCRSSLASEASTARSTSRTSSLSVGELADTTHGGDPAPSRSGWSLSFEGHPAGALQLPHPPGAPAGGLFRRNGFPPISPTAPSLIRGSQPFQAWAPSPGTKIHYQCHPIEYGDWVHCDGDTTICEVAVYSSTSV